MAEKYHFGLKNVSLRGFSRLKGPINGIPLTLHRFQKLESFPFDFI